ncbi:EAL domain-containing protein [Oceaniglobus roseus]|uniref:EAL domain-containing protein n=1 Tax=Oceaniglobus roseus TaxID=1737570 RepID=UPI000C7F2D53|nr:EAL domain-containing protein [Kandeliimicrobium roseum]
MPQDYPNVVDDPTEQPDSPFTGAINERDRDTIAMVEAAVGAGDVLLAFQPVVPSGRQDRPAFYEGLIRVLDRSGRIIPARDFMPTVETMELGRRLDCLALEKGLRCLSEHPRLRLAINMSARSIGYRRWSATLDDMLRRDPTVGERLILEITESSAILMPDVVQGFMDDLQRQGVSFAIDDFGAGYTSLRYLKDLYFDILKIDGQFIRGIARNPDNQAVVKALLSIGRHFDMVTIAESVETAEDTALLTALGVDCMQGYFFGAPSVRTRWAAAERQKTA